ncbi:ABC transporter substrate-binding protein [Hippea alviniae]|uniref:ABC transporter substrate-binding protein n=1 Tax=Hippea alviniae TaxID=1279027 RepID=UPI0003B554AA|nr:helical backbone metal receptor [Hippea alviniae]
MIKKVLFFVVFVVLFAEVSFSAGLRIVSLSPVVTQEIFMLKAQKYLVGCSKYGIVPEGFKIERVGTVTDADVERILKLKANIVFASSLLNPSDIKVLKRLGLKVIVFSQPGSFKQICDDFIKVGKIVGKKDVAEKIVSEAMKKVNCIKDRLKNIRRLKVFVQIGANPLFTATGSSFINDFIRFAGGINIAENSKSGLYSPAKVLKENPDAIIISQMGFNGIKQAERWKQFKFLSAVKHNRILILNDYSLCSPTPVSFAKTLFKIAKFLHPEVSLEACH